MCGRYVSASDRARLLEQFHAVAVDEPELAPDYNVAPSKPVYAVLEREHADAPAVRELRIVQWGLIPSWAKDAKIGNRLVNARLETAGQKPSFRAAYTRRRCLLPADGYYEWYTPEIPKARKQPYFIHSPDGHPLALAGLYEIWRDPTVVRDDPASLRWTCTILTTTATDDLGRIHDRAPLLVPESQFDGWLDPSLPAPPADALIPAAPGLLRADPVATTVNNVANNGPELIKPLPPEAEPPTHDAGAAALD